MLVAPVDRFVVAANEAGTGAYFLIEPSNVQFMPEQEPMYQACTAALYEYIDTFHPTKYPMEKSYGELYQEGFLPPEPPLEPASAVLWNFQEAERAYAWFTGFGEVASDWDERFTVELEDGTEIIYAATKHIEFRTLKEIQNYLNCYFPERTVSGTEEDDCIGGVRFPAPLLHFVYLDNRILKTDSKKHNYVTVKLGSRSAGWFPLPKGGGENE